MRKNAQNIQTVGVGLRALGGVKGVKGVQKGQGVGPDQFPNCSKNVQQQSQSQPQTTMRPNDDCDCNITYTQWCTAGKKTAATQPPKLCPWILMKSVIVM